MNCIATLHRLGLLAVALTGCGTPSTPEDPHPMPLTYTKVKVR